MSTNTRHTDFAAEFQARLARFRGIARAWSLLIVVAVAIGTILQFTGGPITNEHPLSLQFFGVALLAAFCLAALRIYFSYQRLFVCPACGHPPTDNDLSVILLGVWGASKLNPKSCSICSASLR